MIDLGFHEGPWMAILTHGGNLMWLWEDLNVPDENKRNLVHGGSSGNPDGIGFG